MYVASVIKVSKPRVVSIRFCLLFVPVLGAVGVAMLLQLGSSTLMLLWLSEFAWPGVGRVFSILLPTASLMVDPFRVREFWFR